MSLRKLLSSSRLYFTSKYLKLQSLMTCKDDNTLAFIPHGGMYANGYDLFNYKSDNCLSFLHYLIERCGGKYKYRLACDVQQYDELSRKLKLEYPNLDIACFPFFGIDDYKVLYKELMKCSLIFTSESYPLPFKTAKHKVVFLSYFIPFKDDYKCHEGEDYDSLFDLCVSSSQIYSNIVAHTYHVDFGKFNVLGFPRDDELFSPYFCPELDKDIESSVDYKVEKVLLYSPTHRDYEEKEDSKRCVLGFEISKSKMEKFLRENGLLIICKLHSHQNDAVINNNLPNGMVIHKPNNSYGLCELMQRADALITDYTSAYFDYLLLDRPVLFNFYDYQIYKETRGFSYDPLEPIIAGDVFTDEQSFYEACSRFVDGQDSYAEKRRWVRDLQHKYLDCNSSERIYNYLLENKFLIG